MIRAAILNGFRNNTKRCHGIFVNNSVDLSSTKIFGFDYDYTLAEYTPSVSKFIFDSAVTLLVDKYGFPPNIRGMPYDPDFIIKGLFYDPKRAIMMKLDSYSVIATNAVYRGLEPLSEDDLALLYSTRRMGIHKIEPYYKKHAFYQVLDQFSQPEAFLFCAMTQFFHENNLRYEPTLMYRAVRSAISDVHISQLLYKEVARNKELYLGPKDSMRSVISYLSMHKRMFMISNSPFWFINMGMSHLVSPDWRDVFEIVICEACKPGFFLDNNKPFLEMKKLPMDSNSLSGVETRVRYKKMENWNRADKLEKGKIYYEGSLSELGRLTDWDQASVLYFGDQLRADLAEPSLRFGWRTAAIIQELKYETDIFRSVKFKNNVRRLNNIEVEYDRLAGSRDDDERCDKLLRDRNILKDELKTAFNSPFGSTFRTHLTRTHYARQVERFAELYTASIRNFDGINLDRKFFPARTTLTYDP